MTPSRTSRTNWAAVQAPRDPKDKKKVVVPHGLIPRYLAMGSWRTKGKGR